MNESSSGFASFYRLTLIPLRRYLSRMVNCEIEAQDLAQDAFVRVYTVMQERRIEEPKAFLYTTARRLALNRLKRGSNGPVVDLGSSVIDAAVSPGPGTERLVMARQEYAQFERAAAGLPAGCRRVLLLRKVEQLSHKEIAERLGISRSTVEKQLARAFRLLRASMPSDDPELPRKSG